MKQLIIIILCVSVQLQAEQTWFDTITDSVASFCDTTGHVLSSIPERLGKTHFISGFPHAQLETVRKEHEQAQAKRGPVQRFNVEGKRVLFSPDDNLSGALIDLINQERESIRVAVYTFTDNDIAQALIDAFNRGVDVMVVTDPSYKNCTFSKIHTLNKAGVPVFEYNPVQMTKKQMNNIMHHKFAVFGRQTSKDACVWTGSFNFTKSARYNNQENAVIIAQAEVVGVFLEQFERIKQQRCVNCPKNSTVVAHSGHGKVKKNKKMILARA